ncbi:hypothetical protein OEZ86_013886 [Tetradesmus obliquus]|nr:hypothetical protein OEZ86_013886 [Tetradesmus obliquus]
MSKQSGLDWKALLQQKPPPSSVVKKSALKSRQGAHHTPSTPLASSSTGSLVADQQQQQQQTGSSIPFLLLPVAIPEQQENKVPTDQPAADLLAKLAQLKQKAASLADAAAAAKQPAAAGSAAAAQLLQRDRIGEPGADACLRKSLLLGHPGHVQEAHWSQNSLNYNSTPGFHLRLRQA